MQANKLFLSIVALALGSASGMANRVDSVYIKPDVKDGAGSLQIAYSIDKKHWVHINQGLFNSDFGSWGSQKKMYYPIIKYNGRKYTATFIPDPKIPQMATTSSECLSLWKPQDYPVLNDAIAKDVIEEQKRLAAENIIRVPYKDVEELINRQRIAASNYAMEQENYIATGAHIAKEAKSVNAHITVNWDDRKAISPNLLGVFFEDISYAADGGLYAELIQNRDFEYSSADRGGWDNLTGWDIEGDAEHKINKENPISKNNANNLQLNVTNPDKVRIINKGWDGIPLKAKAKYNLSVYLRGKMKVRVSLMDGDKILATTTITGRGTWKEHKAVLVPNADAEQAQLVIQPLTKGQMALDMVSLFPQETFKGRGNGLRKDLAQAIADLKPRFVRFPGGCASHGNGIDNIYHWQATVGDLKDRTPDFNIWNYHQTRGLGFYEYFQFCEDIGAEALPVLAAGVPCQNSWRGGNGQQGGIPFEKDLDGKPSPYTYMDKPLTMESYLQELLDLIEWANGDAKTSKLAQMRAKAGHPKPFNMKYLGIGNEDLLGDLFMERYRFLISGVKRVHPEITVVGTVGPFWEGSDYEYGWKEAKERNIEIVDEHYYNSPGWYFNHRDFYDKYDREGTKVYLGEWASKGNHVSNALVEAAYMTNVERNADVVVMSSYAPLLAKEGYTKWNPDLIYFNNTQVKPTANYYVQKAFGQNAGSEYVYSDITVDYDTDNDKKPLLSNISRRIDKSVVVDKETGDVIVKLVSMLPVVTDVTVSLGELIGGQPLEGEMTLLACPENPDKQKTWSINETTKMTVGKDMNISLPAYSFSTIRIKAKKK